MAPHSTPIHIPSQVGNPQPQCEKSKRAVSGTAAEEASHEPDEAIYDIPLEDKPPSPNPLEEAPYDLIGSDDEQDARKKTPNPTPWQNALQHTQAATLNIFTATSQFTHRLTTAGVGTATSAVASATFSSMKDTLGPHVHRGYTALRNSLSQSKQSTSSSQRARKTPLRKREETTASATPSTRHRRPQNRRCETTPLAHLRAPSPSSSPIAMVGNFDLDHWVESPLRLRERPAWMVRRLNEMDAQRERERESGIQFAIGDDEDEKFEEVDVDTDSDNPDTVTRRKGKSRADAPLKRANTAPPMVEDTEPVSPYADGNGPLWQPDEQAEGDDEDHEFEPEEEEIHFGVRIIDDCCPKKPDDGSDGQTGSQRKSSIKTPSTAVQSRLDFGGDGTSRDEAKGKISHKGKQTRKGEAEPQSDDLIDLFGLHGDEQNWIGP